jgi:membrane protease YdiL (CAAX protease family)
MTDRNTLLPNEIENPQIKSQLWGPWPTLGFGIAIYIVNVLTGTSVIFIFNNEKINPDHYHGLLFSLTTIASAIICVSLILVIIKIRSGATVAEYLSLKRITKKTILILLAITIGISVLERIPALILGESPHSLEMLDLYYTSIWPPLLWIAIVIFAPLFEEVFFRGFLFAGLGQSRIGVVGTIILTALFWTLIHTPYGVYQSAFVFAFGIILGIFRFKTDSLWSPLLMHVLKNLVEILALYYNINSFAAK